MDIAKFRFAVISDFVTGVRHPHGQRARLLEEKSQRQWVIPGSPRSRISKATIMLWVSKYRSSGNRLESLMPLDRQDKSSHRALDLSIRLALTELRANYPDVPCRPWLSACVKTGCSLPMTIWAAHRPTAFWPHCHSHKAMPMIRTGANSKQNTPTPSGSAMSVMAHWS